MLCVSGHIDLSLRMFDRAYVDNNTDFFVSSCGYTVTAKGEPRAATVREHGRPDYQLLYIAKGRYRFDIQNKSVVVDEGNAVIYNPYDSQKYISDADYDSEIYWTHFTGCDCKKILSRAGFRESGAYYVGYNDKFIPLYKWIINEIQLKKAGYTDLAAGYFKQILGLMARNRNSIAENQNENKLVENAMLYFYRHFNENISINDYAKAEKITPCWFRSCFKKATDVSPQQFIKDIRLSYARELLLTTDYKVYEIANRCGYDNAFYFSRIFAKNTGCSPLRFRNDNKKQ